MSEQAWPSVGSVARAIAAILITAYFGTIITTTIFGAYSQFEQMKKDIVYLRTKVEQLQKEHPE